MERMNRKRFGCIIASGALCFLVGWYVISYNMRVDNISNMIQNCYQQELADRGRAPCEIPGLHESLRNLRSTEGSVQSFAFKRLGLEVGLKHWAATVLVRRRGEEQIESIRNSGSRVVIYRAPVLPQGRR